MIPIRDVLPARGTPWVTSSLVGLNLLALAFQLLAPGLMAGLLHGAPSAAAIGLLPFVQAGTVQTAANAWALWLFGENVEDRLGSGRFAGAYLLAAVSAVAAEVTLNPGSTLPVSGAAGAIAGVVAGHLALFRGGRILALATAPIKLDLIDIPAIAPMAIWLLFQLIAGTGIFSVAAGFLIGGVAAWWLKRPERMRVEWWGA